MARNRRSACGRARMLVALVAVGIGAASDPRAATRAASGTLEGTVTLGPELTPRRVSFPLYADPNRVAPRVAMPSLADQLRNVVVYLEHVPAPGGSWAVPSEPYRMEQTGVRFEPHVLAVLRGSTVEFPNRDVVFHNVFSLSKAASFDLGRYPSGTSRSVRFDTPGVVKVFCHIHSDMSAIVVVLDHPFFATPDPDGRYAIAGIPPGEYRVVPWHERARPAGSAVRIEPGHVTRVDFDIPLDVETSDGG